jgi:hypothetical protein
MRAFFFGILAVFLFSACSWSDRDLDAGLDLDGADGGDGDVANGDDGGAGDQVADKGGDEFGDEGDDGGGDEGPRQLRRAVLLGDGGFFGTSGIMVGTANGHAGGSYVIAGHYADISTDPENPIQAGKVYFYNNGSIPTSFGDAVLVLEPPDGVVAGFGYSLSGPCDIDNDGALDLPVGDHLYSPSGESYIGRVVVFWGDQGGTLSLERHSYHWLPVGTRRNFDSMGQSIVCADFNGDGYDDLLSTGQNAGLDDTGIGAVYYGSDAGLPEFPDEIITPQVIADKQYFGSATVYEDLDGDGDRDLAVGAWELIKGTTATDPRTGGVAVFLGGSDWTQGPDYNLFPPTDQVTHMGMDLAYADTGDRRFLVVGVPDYPAEYNGSVFVYEVGMADWQLQPPVVVLRPPGGAIHSGFPSDMAYIPDYYGRDQGALLIGMRYGDASPTVTGVGVVAAFARTTDGTSFEEFGDILSAPDPVSNDSFGISIVPLDDIDGDGLRDFFIGMSQHLEGTPETGTQTGGVVFFY